MTTARAILSQTPTCSVPPYSPDLNPIEQAFAKLKALLRKAEECTRDGLWAAIGRIIDLYKPDESQTSSKC